MKQLPEIFIGDSLSHGTMRTEDLIPDFMFFLQNVKEKCGIVPIVNQIQKEVDNWLFPGLYSMVLNSPHTQLFPDYLLPFESGLQ